MAPAKRLLIVGAGSLGRELASWAKPGAGTPQEWAFGGFLDDNPGALKEYPRYSPAVVGEISSYQPKGDEILLMGIADPGGKLKVAALLEARGVQFMTFVHPSAIVADHVTLGRGVVICPHVVVSCDARIGDFATLNLACTIGHDVRIGPGTTLSAHVDLTGYVEVGAGAFFGSHAVVLPHGKVGDGSKVGAGSVVLRSVKAGATVMGVPAKQISP